MNASKKTIIYITQLFPFPPTSGGRIKSLNTIQTLSKKFNIILICFGKNSPSKKNLASLKQNVHKIKVFNLPNIDQEPKKDFGNLIKNYSKLIPYYVYQFESKKAKSYIDRIIEKTNPEVIHIDHINMAQYLPNVKTQKWILEEHNIEHQLAYTKYANFSEFKKTKIYLFFEFALTYLYEMKFMKKFDHIFSISDFDKNIIEDKFHFSKVSIQKLVYSGSKKSLQSKHKKNKEILFIGDMTWVPNKIAITWFIEKIFPIILKTEPTTLLNVVGEIEGDFVEVYKENKNINFFGFQNNIEKYLFDASVFILPFNVGGGIRIKSLTSFAHSVPVVTTKIGIQGISGKNFKDYLIVNDAREFAKACLLLIRNKTIRKTIGKNGKKYLLENHSTLNNSKFINEYIKITQ